MYHELLHALGLIHEQQRPDFAKHAKINYHNVQRGQEGSFTTEDERNIAYFGVPYDFASLQHYTLNVSWSDDKRFQKRSDFMPFQKYQEIMHFQKYQEINP